LDLALLGLMAHITRLKHTDGRITTVPVHKNDSLPKGLLRKILREDIKMTVETLHTLIKNKNL
jgi:hypothetical protein